MKTDLHCNCCGDTISAGRAALGYKVCLFCGEDIAKQQRHTIVPMHKSNYVVISDKSLLVGLNNKGGLVK
jgi:ribosomal protein L37AE/L43A